MDGAGELDLDSDLATVTPRMPATFPDSAIRAVGPQPVTTCAPRGATESSLRSQPSGATCARPRANASTVGPAPEMTAGTLRARRARTSEYESGIADAR